MKARIQLTDTTQSALFKMSEGNPGALTVCIQILKESESIDPDNIMGGLGFILSLDTLGLYGPKIWMLYKDVCKSNISKTLAVLRGWQLGFVSRNDLSHAVDNYGDGVDVDDISKKVCERLPAFKLKD